MSITGSEQWMYSAGGEFYNFPIEQSLRFNDNDNAYLSRTPASAGNQKTWTFSCWVKRGNIKQANILTAYTSSSNTTNITFDYGSGSNLQWYDYISGYRIQLTCSQVFRDVAGWYHLVFALDTTQSTASDRAKIWVNGERVTAFLEETYPSQNADLKMNTAIGHRIGDTAQFTREFDGYMADVNFIDGQALDPTSFGELKSGIWISKDTADLTFGTNGFRLEYGDSAAIGDDTSGNTNDWTVNNLVASDVVLDSPTNNFGIMSSIDKGDGTATYSEGNLKVSVGDNEEAFGSFGMSSGKWYWEIRYVSSAANNKKIGLGIADTAVPNNNEVTNNGHQGTTYAPNDILAVAVDVDNELFSFYKNGTIIETDTDWSAKGWSSIKPIVTSSNSSGEEVCILNFGQDDTFAGAISATGNTDENGQGVFKYAVPSGYLALCSANLPTGAIDTLADETPEDYFNTVLWTGNGTSQSITGVGFQSDLVWTKKRSSTSSHYFVDAVRGSDKVLFGDSTDAEVTTSNVISSFDSDGFSIGADGGINASGQTFVGWNWKANGAGVSNTDGSITSTVSVGATSQQNWFSVVSWTGTGANATVGHGLNGATPELILLKNRNDATNWTAGCTHYPNGWQNYQRLNDTSAVLTASSVWNNTAPTTSVFTVGTSNTVNGSGDGIIAYCFANAEGLCKVGSYTGNGSSTDGTLVFTGHRPKYVMLKRSDSSGGWNIIDAVRSPTNPNDKRLEAQGSGAEGTNSAYNLDFLSNGFKLKTTNPEWNASGGSYIFLSIAEQPFAFANAR